MKKMHMVSKAHLDPAWQWRWTEGLAEAISTFRVAADFCEEFDGYIFTHNEAVLYEWVEEHEPALFARIQKLVKEGKWAIMGGWYLQPDVVMTSGESIMSQIELGLEYFEKKFGVRPKAAMNVDSFGHSRGLVQILKRYGFEGYVMGRYNKMSYDHIWEGFDGSQIHAYGLYSPYSSSDRNARMKVTDEIERAKEKDVDFCFWGIGNHGGGPSRINLIDLQDLIKTSKDVEVCHSTLDAYFAEASKENLPVYKDSHKLSMVGCYTSMVLLKQANRRLENKIAMAEKMINYVDMVDGTDFDREALKNAKKALAFNQFHDILPGSSIKAVEDDALKAFGYGEDITDKLSTKAFFKLCEGQKKAKDGEIPIMIFNPHPYEIEGEFDVNFMLQLQNYNEDEETIGQVYDKDGNDIPTQNEKAESTFNMDWPKKVSFRGKLAPSSITRFDCKLTVVKKDTLPKIDHTTPYITVENDRMKARISRKTGLIDLYELDGKTYIENSGKIEVYNDNEDPWGMLSNTFDKLAGEFKLMSDKDANTFAGYPDEDMPNVRIVEDGAVRTKVQAFFEYGRSVAVIEYTLPKNGTYIDIDMLVFSNEANKMLKYKLDTKLTGTPYGETAFGHQELFNDEKEEVFHKWCSIKENENSLYVVNRGTYGGSFTDSTMKISLLRTPIYCAHPVTGPIAPSNRFLHHIDMGERRFFFRITAEKDIARQAQIFNEMPISLSFFPSGNPEYKRKSAVTIDNPEVILSSFKKEDDKYKLTLYNASDNANDATVTLPELDKTLELSFGKHEIKMIYV